MCLLNGAELSHAERRIKKKMSRKDEGMRQNKQDMKKDGTQKD